MVPNRFSWKHGQTQTLSYGEAKTYINTIWFTPRSRTDSHLSLESVELNSNLRRFTYDDDGYAKYPVSPYDWVEVIDDAKETAELTLHFRYNPDIDGIEVEKPEINPSYSKKIDFLGDNTNNPGAAIEENNYRLHLDMHSGEDWRIKEDKEKDIIFLLDISGSMTTKFGDGTRIKALRETMRQAVNSLTENENNMISIIVFDRSSNELIRGSNNKEELLGIVNGIKTGSGTNYYDALIDAKKIVEANPEREKSIFFISDGRPNGAIAASERELLYNMTPALSYTNDYAEKFPQVKDFFSIYIGEETGAASILQTMTQRINVESEKYMIQVTYPDQLNSAFDRYMTRFGVAFKDVVITDELSEYADYLGNLKVHMFEEGQDAVELEKDVDYEVLAANNEKVSIELLVNIKPETTYELSFDIGANDKAREEYESTGVYPHIGDPGTNYPGNMTSDGKAGFYSNNRAEFSYNTGSETIVEEYPKPVLQIHEFNPVEAEIEFEKNLTGKDLEAGEFEFTLSELVPNDEDGTEKIILVSRVRNQADGVIDFGDIKFSELGRHIFEVQEVIPESKEPGYTYDERILQVIVDVTRPEGKGLSVDVRYPDGTKFLNRYALETVSVNFQLRKEMLGKALQAGDFEFRLFDGNMQLIETVENRGNGDIIFSNVQFNKPSKYQFVVREVIPNPQDTNIIYDTVPAYISVDVYDNGGKLEADVNYENKETFVNRYQREESRTEADLEFKVVLSGMQLSRNMFEFELIDSMGRTYLAKNNSKGDIYFEGINFNSVGSFEYTVRQKKPDNPISHMNYDEDTKQVIIKVTRDSASGGYGIDVDYDPNNIFYNKYKVSGRIW